MCGLAGIVLNRRNSISLNEIVEAMAGSLEHRGPDAKGSWVDSNQGVGISHRRLSIVDLSDSGHQPLVSSDRKYVIAFNGEIYNHLDLRERLKIGRNHLRWTGHSDTETLIEAIVSWGVERTLEEAVGMFAFALWNTESQEMLLARDRLGEKPLYYSLQNGNLVFGSEIKALQRCPDMDFKIDLEAVSSFVQFGYVPDPKSIFQAVRKVPAGTLVRFSRRDIAECNFPEPQQYWSFTETALRGLNQKNQFDSVEEAANHLEDLLRRSIGMQLMGDVPIGAFLSGGVDSSTIAALMQNQSSRPIRTFSIGFEESEFDESGYASSIAEHLGTTHKSLTVTPRDARDAIPLLPEIYDEPFADSSQIPTYFLSKLAREDVTVALSGDGGDEVFGGYNRYQSAAANWSKIQRIPLWLRKSFSDIGAIVPDSIISNALAPLLSAVSPRFSQNPSDILRKAFRGISAESGLEMYIRLCETGDSRTLKTYSGSEHNTGLARWPLDADLVHQVMAFDTVSYLPGDILTKVDRASMSQSLETRMPFLDHRVVEFAWSLPLSMKVDRGNSKIVLRRVLEKFVPSALFERPKMGFGIPLGTWLRGPLREWGEDLLSEKSEVFRDYFDVSVVRAQWRNHLKFHKNNEYALWNILMLLGWLQKTADNRSLCEQPR